MALDGLNPNPTDVAPLFLTSAWLCALPTKCSRHNTPSRAHAIAKLVKANSSGQEENVLVRLN